MRVIHWFRNDLRLKDNTALTRAVDRASQLLPLFVVDPVLVARHRSAKRRCYLARCVQALAKDLDAASCPLLVVEGKPEKVLAELIEATGADLVTFNRDYSPYAKRRDQRVAAAAERLGSRVEAFKDRVVFEVDEVLTQNGTPFRVFTPYRNAWTSRWKRSPAKVQRAERLPQPLPAPGWTSSIESLAEWAEGDLDEPAGEAAAAQRLVEFLDTSIEHYEELRDLPAEQGTSRLSPALRFGTISIRTCVHGAIERRTSGKRYARGADKWLDELIWRDFYAALLSANPHVLGGAFREEYRDVEWNDDPEGFAAWCEGRTGYPIVDAAMRQLVTTGWMHNRARMIVASFLVKDLLIDWRKGERFFMEHLVDGDPASNNGGWQWAASTGTDAQPYFRIFNPVSQGKRYDPEGRFVRRFVPELEPVSKRYIHEPWQSPSPPAAYPAPIVDHAERRLSAIARFEAAKEAYEKP